MLFVYWFLWPLRLVWLLVCCIYEEVYLQVFKCVSFWLHGCCWEWEGGPVNQVYHTSWVALVTPTDRPKSVRNRCLIELFCGVVCVATLPFWHFCWCRGFCHRTGMGQISSLLSFCTFTWHEALHSVTYTIAFNDSMNTRFVLKSIYHISTTPDKFCENQIEIFRNFLNTSYFYWKL